MLLSTVAASTIPNMDFPFVKDGLLRWVVTFGIGYGLRPLNAHGVFRC
jgi:hypothetical protein